MGPGPVLAGGVLVEGPGDDGPRSGSISTQDIWTPPVVAAVRMAERAFNGAPPSAALVVSPRTSTRTTIEARGRGGTKQMSDGMLSKYLNLVNHFYAVIRSEGAEPSARSGRLFPPLSRENFGIEA